MLFCVCVVDCAKISLNFTLLNYQPMQAPGKKKKIKFLGNSYPCIGVGLWKITLRVSIFECTFSPEKKIASNVKRTLGGTRVIVLGIGLVVWKGLKMAPG